MVDVITRIGWFASVRSRPWLALAILVLSQLMALTAWLFLPHQYKATAEVLLSLDPGPVQTVRNEAQVNVIAARMALLTSRLVVDRVVARSGIAQSSLLRARWAELGEGKLAYDDWISAIVAGGLVPSTRPGSMLVDVSYVSASPEFASVLANLFAEELAQVADQLNKGYDQFAEGTATRSVEVSRDEMARAHQEVLSVSRAGLLLGVGEGDPELRSFLRGSRLANASRIVSTESAILAETANGQTDHGSLLDDAEIRALRSSLTALRARQAAAVISVGAAHPGVQAMEAQIASVESSIRIHEAKRKASTQVQAAIRSEAMHAAERAELRDRDRLLSQAGDKEHLQLSLERFESRGQAYEDAMVTQAALLLNKDAPRTDVIVVSQAPKPDNPWWPSWEYYIPTSLVVSLLCVLFACHALERMDRRVSSVESIEVLVGVPVLGRISRKV